jgi:hypothetical protein|tara:strand:+ start:166 stop:387 length:222 start_codon:yes stop_codon:yes gene_type:complete
MSVLKTYDLNPDGVHIVVNWDNMGINASVFILCINTVEATKQIKRIFISKGWESEIRTVVEDGKLGVRVWRMS